MNRYIFWLLLAGSALFTIPQRTSHAEELPSFSAAASSWKATDIIVVHDGIVQAVWKGDLEPGVRSPMEKFNWRDPKVYYGFGREQLGPNRLPPDVVTTVSGKHVVLFLVRDANEPLVWRPAADNFGVSAVWIENDKCFAVKKIINPGPALIRPMMWREPGHKWAIMSEANLKTEVEAHCKMQARFMAAKRVEDPTERARALVQFHTESGGQTLSYLVYHSLIECGEPAWPVVRPLLFDEQRLSIHATLIFVGTQIDPKVIVPDMERIVEEEIEHWRTIPQDQINDLYHKTPLSHHFERLTGALIALQRAEYDDSKNIVATLRQNWDSSDVLRVLGTQRRETVSPVLKYANAILGNRPVPLKLPDEGQHSIKKITGIADKAVTNLIPRGDYRLAISSAKMILYHAPSLTEYPEYQAAVDEQIGRIRDALREAIGDRDPEVWAAWNRNVEATIKLTRPDK